MASVSVNGEYLVNGRMSVKRYLNELNEIVVTGTFATHYYVEEITSLETYRYLIEGVEVISEDFGSDDFDIIYTFKANSIDVKNGFSNLSEDKIQQIEETIYSDNGYTRNSLLAEEERRTENE